MNGKNIYQESVNIMLNNKKFMPARNILLSPGPTTTTDTVKFAQIVSDICPREKEFSKVVQSICDDLVRISGGDKDYVTILFGGSGTAGMDAVINSVVPQDKKILVINNGAYGERFAEIARAYGIDAIELNFKWDELPDVNRIEEVLNQDSSIHAIALVHHETTTGMLNPVRETGEIAKKHKKIYIVDAISSFGGIPFNIKEFNIDFMVSVPNKCLQGFAGLCFVICNKKELEKIKDYPRKSYYLSLYDNYEFFKDRGETRFTPPVQTVYAFRQALDEFLEEGGENRFNRYTENWQILRKGMQDLGFKILLNPQDEAHLLITVIYPKDRNFNFAKLHDKLYENGFTIYPGKLGKLNTFRIANMGDINQVDIMNFLAALKKIIIEIHLNLQNDN